jgi:lipopolysaccharide/colanic/teichoic acid biosynthesis glycosyltransferase
MPLFRFARTRTAGASDVTARSDETLDEPLVDPRRTPVRAATPTAGRTASAASSSRLPRFAPASSRKRHVRELFNPDQTHAVLRRERARADRQQSYFTLVLFHIDGDSVSEASLLRLATIILRQVRETDEVGRFDQNTICAVLPDTDPVGASMLIARVRRAARGKDYEPSCTVYTYPEPPPPSAKPPADPQSGDAASDSATGATGTGAAGPIARLSTPAGDASIDVVPARGMDEFFAEPLPFWKRCIDVSVATAALVAASPLLIGAAVAIKMFDPGPIFFFQQRTGLGGRPFKIWKLRTMRVDAEKLKDQLRKQSEQDGPAFKMTHDPRITRVGRFLRKTSIDELPQLINVLLGDMTLVGPRPLPVKEADGCKGWQYRRHDVTPGLTCIWQVEGRSRVKFDEWMRMDMRYAKRRRIWSDISLVLRTIPAVLLRRGAQ